LLGGPPPAADRLAGLRRFALVFPRPFVATALCGTLLLGTVSSLAQARRPHDRQVQQQALLDHLRSAGTTRLYTDYWTCNALAFLSREQIVCAVLNEDLTTGFDRVRSYRTQVAAAPHAPYVFRDGSAPARLLSEDPATRVVAHVAGYVVLHRAPGIPATGA
jgi:hypothetical protein